MRPTLTAILCLAACLVTACRPAPTTRPPGPLRIVVSIAPLSGLVREIAPEGAQVTTLVPPGRSLHGYELTPSDVRAVAHADVLVYVGLGLEARLDALLRDHPSSFRKVVCFAEAVGIKAEEEHDHDHEGDHDHHHHAVDPHLWLDPGLVEKLIPAVADTIKQADPAAAVDARAAALIERVGKTDEDWRAGLRPLAGASFVTHHNAFGRLAERYGFKIAAVVRASEQVEPTADQVAAAVRAIRDTGAVAVIREPQYDAASAEAIARAAGVPVITLDAEGTENWFTLMRSNLDALRSLITR